jgi:hypothetical protein
MPAAISTSGDCETLGAVRECAVNFEGREGHVVEECVICEPPHSVDMHQSLRAAKNA